MYFDPLYLILSLPALLLSMLASFYVKSTFAKYSRVAASSGLTGAQAAFRMLAVAGVHNVRIEQTSGFLSDHYDPTTNTLRLSQDVYGSQSLSAIGVACHEAGHALQKASNYAPMGLRSALVLPANIGSKFSYLLFALGFCFHSASLLHIGLLLFAASVLFTVVTLPVEWNASARAKVAMLNAGIVTQRERDDAGSVLNAAFLTYVAAAVSAVMTLLYYMIRLGLIGSRRD